MTDREKAIVMAYTGKTMLAGAKFSIFHKYIEELLQRPVFSHEIGFLADEIKKRSYADFCKICETSEEPAEVAGLDLKIEIVTLLQDIIDMGGTGAKKGTYDDGWDSAIGEVVKLFTERFSLQIDNGEQQEEDEK